MTYPRKPRGHKAPPQRRRNALSPIPHACRTLPQPLLLVLALALAGCGKGTGGGKTEQPAAGNGKETLTLAIVPSKDALSLYYAERSGIYRRLGLELRIETYASQLDCDTALLGGRTDGGTADLHRMAECHGREYAARFTPLWKSAEEWQLFCCGTLRVKSAGKLAGRMVAISRQSAENAALDRILQKNKMKQESVYRPQINALPLRARMLDNNQVDAAMLRWPYTSLALAAGHRALCAAPAAGETQALVLRRRKGTKAQTDKKAELLLRGYNMAADSLRNQPQAETLRHIFCTDYALPAEVADTIKLPRLSRK